MVSDIITPPVNTSGFLETLNGSGLCAETLMLQIQMLVTEDFNEQMEELGEKIELLSDVKQAYRENVNKIKQFMAQNANTSREDGRVYYEASAAQMANLCSALVEYNYDLDSGSFDPSQDYQTMTVLKEQGYTDTGTMQEAFEQIANMVAQGDMEGAIDQSESFGDDDNNLPLYYGHTNNTFEDGSPKFAVLSESLDAMLEEVNNFISDVEEESEQLSVDLNQLTKQRRVGLEGANELMRKMAEIRSNTVSKMDG